MTQITEKWSLQRWCSGFYKIYRDNDSKRTLSHFWLQVSNDASKVAESVRRQKYDFAMYNIGNAFCWTCCFVERLKEDIKKLPNGEKIFKKRGKKFQDWILYRYPLCCHHCGYELCRCLLYSETMEHRKEDQAEEFKKLKEGVEKRLFVARKSLKKESKFDSLPLNKLFGEFNKIYGNKVFSANLEDITFHYLEEVGEVGHAITLLETLIGHNTVDELKIKIRNDPDLKLTDHYDKNTWKNAFKLTKSSKKGKKIRDIIRKLEKDSKLNQLAVESICHMIIDEIADVFSWTTAIVNKIQKLGKKYPIIEVFEGADWIPIEKRGKTYLYGTGTAIKFRCPYCVEPECKNWCPLNNILTKVSESLLKGN